MSTAGFWGYFYWKAAEEARNRIFTINYSYSICSNRIGFGNLMEAVSCWLSCLWDHCWNINSSLVGRPVPFSCPEKQISHTQKATERMGWGVHRCVWTREQSWPLQKCKYANLTNVQASLVHRFTQTHTHTHARACMRTQTNKRKHMAPHTDGMELW